jgi:hypothetical protein
MLKLKSSVLKIDKYSHKCPDKLFVGVLKSGEYSKISYKDYGMGLACFVSQGDSKHWIGFRTSRLKLVLMSKKDIKNIAIKERVQYVHILSGEINKPISHFETLCL